MYKMLQYLVTSATKIIQGLNKKPIKTMEGKKNTLWTEIRKWYIRIGKVVSTSLKLPHLVINAIIFNSCRWTALQHLNYSLRTITTMNNLRLGINAGLDVTLSIMNVTLVLVLSGCMS